MASSSSWGFSTISCRNTSRFHPPEKPLACRIARTTSLFRHQAPLSFLTVALRPSIDAGVSVQAAFVGNIGWSPTIVEKFYCAKFDFVWVVGQGFCLFTWLWWGFGFA